MLGLIAMGLSLDLGAYFALSPAAGLKLGLGLILVILVGPGPGLKQSERLIV